MTRAYGTGPGAEALVARKTVIRSAGMAGPISAVAGVCRSPAELNGLRWMLFKNKFVNSFF
jgi:hypothetical protein